MRIYRIKTDRKLFSFNDPISSVPIMGQTLKSFQEEEIKKSGLELCDLADESEYLKLVGNSDDDFFSFEDDLIFTSEFVKSCLSKAATSQTSLEFFLEYNSFNERYLFQSKQNKELSFNFKFHKKSSDRSERVLITQKIFINYIKIPKQIYTDGQYHFDQCEVWINRLSSPFHLLYSNLALNFGRSIKTQKLFPQWVKDTFFPHGSRAFYAALKSMNKIGKNCKIHKSAILEGVELADNVTIGANCVIRLSKIESGTTVEDNTTLNYSIIGKNNYVSANNFVNICMTYDDVYLIHGPYQFSIYGRGVAVMAVINCDFRLDQKNIVIPTNLGYVDSAQTLLGIAYGHDSVVGGGNIIAPGRIVPNGLKITPPDQIIITKFDSYVEHK